MEQTMNQQPKKHLMSFFHKDIYVSLKNHNLAIPTSRQHGSLNIFIRSIDRRPRNCKTRPSPIWRKKWISLIRQSLSSVSSKRSCFYSFRIQNKQSRMECTSRHVCVLSEEPTRSARPSLNGADAHSLSGLLLSTAPSSRRHTRKNGWN